MTRRAVPGLLIAAALWALAALPSANGRGTQAGEWRYWGGDEGSTRYSPLDQINAQNVGGLRWPLSLSASRR